MKRIIALFFIVVIATSSLFAFKFNSLGIETGKGFHLSADMEIIDNLDGYVRFGYTGAFQISLGAQYKVAELKISQTTLPLKPGLQMGFAFADEYFSFSLLGTFSFSYDHDVFTAFLRPGIGLYTYPAYEFNKDYDLVKKTKAGFAFQIETGVAFKF